jgi:hypothetical protein
MSAPGSQRLKLPATATLCAAGAWREKRTLPFSTWGPCGLAAQAVKDRNTANAKQERAMVIDWYREQTNDKRIAG